MSNIFIGVENELVSYDKQGYAGITSDEIRKIQEHLIKNNINVRKEETFRTAQGNGYYKDGMEVEILTPPIALNNGFATRLTDSLEIGRNHALEALDHMTHTGYSMHWNISDSEKQIKSYLITSMAPIISLFGTTPLSIGIGYREKSDDSSPRMEILSDHINNIDQVNAHALFLGAARMAAEFSDTKFPYFTKLSFFQNQTDFHNGRYQHIPIFDKESLKKTIVSTQEYIELMYNYLEPYIMTLGTKKEVENLADFVHGNKELEFDKFRYYATLKNLKIKKGLLYRTVKKDELEPFTKYSTGENMISTKRDIETPLEGKLIGFYVDQHAQGNIKIKKFKWHTINYEIHSPDMGPFSDIIPFNDEIKLESTIYKKAAEKLGVEYEGSIEDLVLPLETKLIKKPKKITYDSSKDFSAYPPSRATQLKIKLPSFFGTLYAKDRFVSYLHVGLFLLLGAVGGITVGDYFDKHYEKMDTRKYYIEKSQELPVVETDSIAYRGDLNVQ